ncbi:hypothetical protein OH76DRAFT_214844 [Lentinus brumalis]|uniref:Uncharacterized protein n=1 Tax=Lentinus brumalis TaxID=2498619 RepID=A0A371CMK7_9APHY|nr:hypothetical protein OH76DRAFT_214844 [Polyporus brumalis]
MPLNLHFQREQKLILDTRCPHSSPKSSNPSLAQQHGRYGCRRRSRRSQHNMPTQFCARHRDVPCRPPRRKHSYSDYSEDVHALQVFPSQAKLHRGSGRDGAQGTRRERGSCRRGVAKGHRERGGGPCRSAGRLIWNWLQLRLVWPTVPHERRRHRSNSSRWGVWARKVIGA